MLLSAKPWGKRAFASGLALSDSDAVARSFAQTRPFEKRAEPALCLRLFACSTT